MDSEHLALTEYLRSEEQKVEFLRVVKNKYGDKLRQVCVELLMTLPPGSDCQAFTILTKAKLRLQEPQLHDLAAMNAAPFNSARDLDEPHSKKKKQ